MDKKGGTSRYNYGSSMMRGLAKKCTRPYYYNNFYTPTSLKFKMAPANAAATFFENRIQKYYPRSLIGRKRRVDAKYYHISDGTNQILCVCTVNLILLF